MMKLVTTTERLDMRFGEDGALKLIKEAGFDGFDYSLIRNLSDENSVLLSEGYKEYAYKLRALADTLNLECRQAHAPFPVAKGEAEYDKVTFGRIVRSIEIASILGAKTIVVHPISFLNPYFPNKETLYQYNMEYFGKLIPYAEKFNIKLAIENMYSTGKFDDKKTDGVCSHAEEILRYVNDLNSPFITACLDTGHAALCGEEPGELALQIKDVLGALHVSDNNYKLDDHTIPYAASLDWEGFTASLAEIDYKGDFTFEVLTFFDGMQNEFIPVALKYLHDLGRHMIQMIERKKK